MNFAIDFDGVIHSYEDGWQDGTVYGTPIRGAKRALAKLIIKGHKVIIFTTRFSKEANGEEVLRQKIMVEHWLDQYGFKKGYHYHHITGEKPIAQVYVDDRAYKFTDWETFNNKF